MKYRCMRCLVLVLCIALVRCETLDPVLYSIDPTDAPPIMDTAAPDSTSVAPPATPAAPPVTDAESLIQPDDFTYLGAFRLPDDGDRPRTFEYGGNAMTHNPANNTLFITGHDRLAWGELPDGSQVAEISIPAPVMAQDLASLPVADFIQGFQAVAKGYFHDLEEIPRVGMAYLDHPATGPKIHWGWGQHMPPDDSVPTHGWFNPDLTQADFTGAWYIGNQDFNSVNGYLFTIPTEWADAYAQGRQVATGRYRDGGWGGMGPTLFAYRPWQEDGSPSPSGTHVEETVLLLYENSQNSEAFERAMAGYQHPDEWEGGAWLTTESGKSAVLFAGTKSVGAKYWYGWVNPAGPDLPCVEVELVDQFTTCRLAEGVPCPAEDLQGCQGHNDYRGWWSTGFSAQFILYDPGQLAHVAAGTLESWEPQPYASVTLDEHLYFNPPEWELDNLGRGVQRRMRIGAVAFDRVGGRLYVLELFGDGAKPVVHVWGVA